MSDEVVLPQKYSLILLRKLAYDDIFRNYYESFPAQALKRIDVPDEILARVSPESLKSIRLADKEVFAEALSMLVDEMVSVSLCQIVPQIHVFSPLKENRIKSTISFAAGGCPVVNGEEMYAE